MSCSIETCAIKYNNQGVYFLKCGLYDEAVSAFTESLFMAKRLMAMYQECYDAAGHTQTRKCDESYCLRPYCDFVQLKSSPYMESNSRRGFIFSSPIEVHDDLEGAPMHCYLRMSFIVMFNLAISHHLLAMSNQDRMTQIDNLEKATRLYQLAYGIHMQEDVNISVYQTIPIVNNLSQVHYSLGNFRDANVCCKNLLTTLVFLRECGEDKTVDNLDGFYSNVMHLVLQDRQVATAA